MPITTLKENQLLSNIFFITIKTIKGIHILKRKEYFNIILNSLEYCRENKGMILWAYTILINHLHLVFKIKPKFKIQETIRDFKKFTANQILKQLKKDNESNILKNLQYAAIQDKDRKYKVWEYNCVPKAIFTEKFLHQKIFYVDYNAVKHNIVKDINEYPYTSYHNHDHCNPILLKIDPINLNFI